MYFYKHHCYNLKVAVLSIFQFFFFLVDASFKAQEQTHTCCVRFLFCFQYGLVNIAIKDLVLERFGESTWEQLR